MQVDFVTAHLASAHIPLATLVFGLQTDLDTSGAKQVIFLSALFNVKALSHSGQRMLSLLSPSARCASSSCHIDTVISNL